MEIFLYQITFTIDLLLRVIVFTFKGKKIKLADVKGQAKRYAVRATLDIFTAPTLSRKGASKGAPSA